MMNKLWGFTAGLLLATSSASWAGTAASLVGIGRLPGAPAGSDVTALSRDGSTAIGWSRSATGTEAIRFKNGLLQGLGDFDGGAVSSRAICVSADGNTIGGQGTAGNVYPPFLWNESSGFQGINGLPYGEVRAITPDGKTYAIAGAAGCPWLSSYGWTGNQYLQWPSDIRAISDDGLVCFGEMNITVGCDVGNCTNRIAKRFTIDRFSGARAQSGDGPICSLCSADGTVGIAGGAPEGVYQWTNAGTALIAGTTGMILKAGTPSLSALVGSATIGGTLRAVVWTAKTGMQTLETYISGTFGVSINTQGWILTSCNGISGNGLVFAGSGTNKAGEQEGWVLRVIYDWNNNGIDDAQEIKDGLIGDVDNDGIADCYQSGIDCPGPNIAANPGFEAGNVLGDCMSELLTAGGSTGSWHVVSGVAERANRSKSCSGGNWGAEFGTYAIELRSTGGGPGTIRQAITTEPGRHYRVSFWMSANCTSGGAVSVRASAGNSSKTFSRTCESTDKQSWLRCEFDFVADLTTETLEFASENQPYSGPVIDAISVSDVTVGCPSDLDGNGQVDTGDIGLLLLNFGPCQ